MSMTEARLKTFPLEADAVISEEKTMNFKSDEWRDFAAQMACRSDEGTAIRSVGITVEQAIDALRVAVEEDLCSLEELDG